MLRQVLDIHAIDIQLLYQYDVVQHVKSCRNTSVSIYLFVFDIFGLIGLEVLGHSRDSFTQKNLFIRVLHHIEPSLNNYIIIEWVPQALFFVMLLNTFFEVIKSRI